VDHRYWPSLFWGRDYPHPEGTWKYTKRANETPLTHLSLRHTFAGIPEAEMRAMVGTNAIAAYGLDYDKLRVVADKIGPTVEQITTPLAAVPELNGPEREGLGLFSFRTVGPWA
jgi:hypothetical protein